MITGRKMRCDIMKYLKTILSSIVIIALLILIINNLSYSRPKTVNDNTENSTHLNNSDTINVIHNGSGRGDGNSLIYPSEETIVIRMDDVGEGDLWDDTIINVTDAILERNMSITMGVIPNRRIENNKIMLNYLLNKVGNPRVEIAQHGTNHSINEMENLSEYDAYNVIVSGLDKLTRVLNVRPVTYIPPYEKYNENTTKALSRLGFKIISADSKEYIYTNNVATIRWNAGTQSWKNVELDQEKDYTYGIVTSCYRSLNVRNLCVILIHPQDFINEDNKMDKYKYTEFVRLLDNLGKLNARFATFRDLNNV